MRGTASEQIAQLKKMAATSALSVQKARKEAETAVQELGKAEQTIRNQDRQMACLRDRLDRAEAQLRSLGFEMKADLRV